MRAKTGGWRSNGVPAVAAILLAGGLIAGGCKVPMHVPATVEKGKVLVPARIVPAKIAGGFSLAGPIERYGPANLWKKIDGAADLFISYDFRELLAANYSRPGAELPELEVSIYEMGTDLNALGVYLAERSEDVQELDIGWGGYVTGDGLFFHKGPYYVKIVDLSEEGTLGKAARELARYVDRRIKARERAVAEMEVFPSEGRVPGSLLYIHRDAFGHGFLQGVFKADYKVEGRTATLFYCRCKDAEQLLAKYRDYAKQYGEVEREWDADGLRLLSLSAFGRREIVFLRGDVFGGVLGCPDRQAAVRLIKSLLANMEHNTR